MTQDDDRGLQVQTRNPVSVPVELDWNNPRIDVRSLPISIKSNIFNRKLPYTVSYDDATPEQLVACVKEHRLDRMTPKEVLEEWLAWEGFHGYDLVMRNLFESLLP